MKLRDKVFINQFYREYYFLNYKKIYNAIKDPVSREFALIDEEGVMKRHLSINSVEEFREMLQREKPKDLYHSTAYYLFPDRPMEQKERRAADLVFDLDADHIPGVPVKKIYKCAVCGETFKTNTEKCGICGGRLGEISIIDSDSIDVVRDETIRLIDLLTNDLGISEDRITLYFSGGRGFHVHIVDEPYIDLDSIERLEIKDYISLEGLDLKFVDDPDARPIRELIRLYKVKRNLFKKYFSEKEIVELERVFKSGEEILRFIKNAWKKNRSLVERLNKILSDIGGVGIDGVVTVDTSRLIRAEYSLHGKTGLIKTCIPIEEIDQIDFISYSSTDEKVLIDVDYLPNMRWGEYIFNEIFNTRVKLPITLAIYLLNKGLAHGIERI
jgi:DNA primase small subunit